MYLHCRKRKEVRVLGVYLLYILCGIGGGELGRGGWGVTSSLGFHARGWEGGGGVGLICGLLLAVGEARKMAAKWDDYSGGRRGQSSEDWRYLSNLYELCLAPSHYSFYLGSLMAVYLDIQTIPQAWSHREQAMAPRYRSAEAISLFANNFSPFLCCQCIHSIYLYSHALVRGGNKTYSSSRH